MSDIFRDLAYQIEGLRLMNIAYYNPNDIDPNKSYFNPEESINEKTLSILMKTESSNKLPRDLKLKLVLTSYRNKDYETIKIKPIECYVKLECKSDNIIFNFIDARIPIPNNAKFIRPVYDYSCDGKCLLKPEIITGEALEYCFLLYLKYENNVSPCGIPLTARYTGSDTVCDVKCEDVDYVCEADDDYPITLKLNKHKIYCKIAYCVTHCSAPPPKEFYYVDTPCL